MARNVTCCHRRTVYRLRSTRCFYRIAVNNACGTQLVVHAGDSVCGVSVRIRTTDDVIQIWNDDSSLAEKSTVRYTGTKFACS